MSGPRDHDVAVIGAGPAGLAAALHLVEAGLRVAVLDEQPRVGGQILRQPPSQLKVRDWMDEAPYRPLKALASRAESETRIDWRLGCSVWGLFRSTEETGGFDIRFVQDDRSGALNAGRVLVAAGCTEMAVPFPGWQLPGVMGAGALQSFYKSQQLVLGQDIVLAGSHPLLLVVAQQLARAGGRIAGVFFAQPWQRLFAALRRPRAMAAGVPLLRQAAGLILDLGRRGIPLHFSACIIAAKGQDRLQALEWREVANGRPVPGTGGTLACDALGVSYGFLPATELARLAGATATLGAAGGWEARCDPDGRTDVPGLYVAGEQAGVKGAAAALEEGKLAALAVLADLGRLDRDHPDLRRGRASMASHRRVAALLADLATMPDDFFDALLTDDTLMCRCEDLERRALAAVLAENPLVHGASALKLLSRAGMGLCQGRYCESTMRRFLRARGVDRLGAFRPRAPVRPVPIEALCRASDARTIRWDDLHSCNDPEHR